MLGGGVMGSAIAAQFANAGVPSLVLDIVPRGAHARREGAGLDAADHRRCADRLAADAVARWGSSSPRRSSRPSGFLITIGNIEDDLPAPARGRLDHRGGEGGPAASRPRFWPRSRRTCAPTPLLTSNTSGLSLAAMSAVLPAELRPRFLGTHFFNPPRYMKPASR